MADLFYQCMYKRPTATGGYRVGVSWLPARYAVKGKRIKLKETGSLVWTVERIGKVGRTKAQLHAARVKASHV
jgi:hypothetical protein